jgi:hypothetical protein
MLLFLVILIVVCLVALALVVLAFFGVGIAGFWLTLSRKERRIVLIFLGMIVLVAALLYLWVESLPPAPSP